MTRFPRRDEGGVGVGGGARGRWVGVDVGGKRGYEGKQVTKDAVTLRTDSVMEMRVRVPSSSSRGAGASFVLVFSKPSGFPPRIFFPLLSNVASLLTGVRGKITEEHVVRSSSSNRCL